MYLTLIDNGNVWFRQWISFEYIKTNSTSTFGYFIVFNKKDIVLKIHLDKIKKDMPMQEFCSKVDVKILNRIQSEDIISILEYIPNHLDIRLEVDCIEQIIELMKCEMLIEKLKQQGTNFLYNDIEIKPKIIISKQDENNFEDEFKKREAKKNRLNMNCDK